jgi:hypothetical protein
MTHERDFDRIARAWLAAGPDVAPDRAVAAVLEAIETTPQVRRPWRWPVWRQIHMSPRTFALIGALALALLVGSGLVLRSPHEVARPTSPPSTVPQVLVGPLVGFWDGTPRQVPGFDRSPQAYSRFREDGHWDASGVNIPSGILFSDVALTGPDTVTLTTTTSKRQCETGDVGTYRFTLSPGNNRLTLTALAETCSDRALAAQGEWVRNQCTTGGGIAGGDYDCYGNLEPGTYRSRAVNLRFDISHGEVAPLTYGAITFTVPDGWAHVADNATRFWMMPSDQYPRVHDGVALDGLYVFGDPRAASRVDGCPFEPQPGVGQTPDELMAYLTSVPSLDLSAPRPITINGRSGLVTDIKLDAGWKKSCDWHDGTPIAPILYANTGLSSVAVGAHERLILLDIGHGDTVAIEIFGAKDAGWTDYVAGTMPIVESFVFAEPEPQAQPSN